MNRQKALKLKREIRELRLNVRNVERRELESLAGAVGRIRFNRGKEPTYVFNPNPFDSDAPYPLSIPGHGKTFPAGTTKSILNTLDEDLDRWLEKFEDESNSGDGEE